MLMQFEQSYRSNNLNVDSPKELYRRNTEANWHIVYEGNRTFPAPDTAIVDNWRACSNSSPTTSSKTDSEQSLIPAQEFAPHVIALPGRFVPLRSPPHVRPAAVR